MIRRSARSDHGRLLVAYSPGFRQITAALGMKDIGGHPQAVRPLVAPMAEAAAEKIPRAISGR